MNAWRERYKIHPAADVFPMLDADELAGLANDIKTHGLRKRIIFLRNGADVLLIDGRNRLAAMEMAGIEIDAAKHCQTSESMADPVAYIVSVNIRRRHLTKQQQADLIVATHQALGNPSPSWRGVTADPVKAAAIATAKAMPNGPSKRTIERAFEKATEHPNAPPRLRAAARRQRKRETLQAYHQLLATLPRTVEGARRFYLQIVARHVVDIDAEMQAVVDGLQRIASQPDSERLRRRAER
jgi:hypothetical protein